MKRRILLLAVLLIASILLASCAANNDGTPTPSETETIAPATDAQNGVENENGGEADTALDNLANGETLDATEQATESETETESETIDYIIIGDDDDTDTSMVPSDDESVGDQWEPGGVPLN